MFNEDFGDPKQEKAYAILRKLRRRQAQSAAEGIRAVKRNRTKVKGGKRIGQIDRENHGNVGQNIRSRGDHRKHNAVLSSDISHKLKK